MKLAFGFKKKTARVAVQLDDNDDDEPPSQPAAKRARPDPPPPGARPQASPPVRPAAEPHVAEASRANVSCTPDADAFAEAHGITHDDRKVVDKLATFVAKVGRSFEQVTKDKNPTGAGNPFDFLYHPDGVVYRYYALRLAQAEAAASPAAPFPPDHVDATPAASGAPPLPPSWQQGRPPPWADRPLPPPPPVGGAHGYPPPPPWQQRPQSDASRLPLEEAAGRQGRSFTEAPGRSECDKSPARLAAEAAAAAGDTAALMNYHMRQAAAKEIERGGPKEQPVDTREMPPPPETRVRSAREGRRGGFRERSTDHYEKRSELGSTVGLGPSERERAGGDLREYDYDGMGSAGLGSAVRAWGGGGDDDHHSGGGGGGGGGGEAAAAPAPVRRHHIAHNVPSDEMAKFMQQCEAANGDKTKQAALEASNRIGADNLGHRLLSKMGWKEGAGLGASGNGMVNPVTAGGVKQNTLGVGAGGEGPTHEVKEGDDIYAQYQKRMMLGYKHRPNPLGNPRKNYY